MKTLLSSIRHPELVERYSPHEPLSSAIVVNDRSLVPKFHLGTHPAHREISFRASSAFHSTPTGLKSLSPGLAHQCLPWVNSAAPNPERVESASKQIRGNMASTPTGLGRFLRLPSVAALPQPWAECLQPFQGCPEHGAQQLILELNLKPV